MDNKKSTDKVKPKQYSHIDYEALLIYVMKKRISVSKVIEELELDISRATIVRNINKINKQSDGKNEVINLYQKKYVPNMQKSKMPWKIAAKINALPEKGVIVKDELEELYDKLSKMKEILDQCDGNLTEATRRINSGNTILGNVHISRQGFGKNIQRFQKVKEAIKARNKEKESREEK